MSVHRDDADLQFEAVLRERALDATGLSVSITDPRQPSHPLVWVNPAFTATTGYPAAESVGRNCRFLQGPDTDLTVVAEISANLRAGRPSTTTLLNYRKDGTPFWNELSISPIRDHAGAVTHFVGVQADVTGRVEAQRSRDDALAQLALAADRLALLADVTSRMALCQQPQQILQMLGAALVPRVGTWCVVWTADSAGHLSLSHSEHERAADPRVVGLLDQLRAVAVDQLQDGSPTLRVLNGTVPHVLIRDYDAAPASESGAAYDDRTSLIHQLGARSLAVVPLLARGGIAGAVAVVADGSRPPLGEEELSLIRDMSVRAGLMLENSQLYARERAAASTLQRSLLPRVPDLPDVDVAASYVPAADEVAVGGDWYDVFAVRGGGVGVVVGDVMGHNMDSAARMGKLSTVLRAYFWPGGNPQQVLSAVDELLAGSDTTMLATCVCAKLTPHADGATLRYSSAGHPPAIVRWSDGTATTLDEGRGAMLGVSRLLIDGAARPADGVVELRRGATLVCFTDGMVDAFGAEPDTDVGLAEMCALIGALPPDASPQEIVDTLTDAGRRHSDDVAVVALRIA